MDPLSEVDLNLLLALHHLLESASVQAAATELGVGQSAMSASLARLRRLLGDPLLLRAGRSMRRTPRADELRGPVGDLVDQARGVLVGMAPFHPATDAWTVRVAMSEETRVWLGPRLVSRIRREASAVDLRLRRLTPGSPGAGRTGELDLAVFPEPTGAPVGAPPDLAAFVIRPLYSTQFLVAASEHHPRGASPWTLAEYAAADHVLVVSWEETDRGFVDDVLAQHELTRRIAVSVPSFAEALALVQQDPSLITTIPEVLAGGPGLRTWALPWGERVMRISYAFHPRGTRDPRMRWLRAALEDAARHPSPAGAT